MKKGKEITPYSQTLRTDWCARLAHTYNLLPNCCDRKLNYVDDEINNLNTRRAINHLQEERVAVEVSCTVAAPRIVSVCASQFTGDMSAIRHFSTSTIEGPLLLYHDSARLSYVALRRALNTPLAPAAPAASLGRCC